MLNMVSAKQVLDWSQRFIRWFQMPSVFHSCEKVVVSVRVNQEIQKSFYSRSAESRQVKQIVTERLLSCHDRSFTGWRWDKTKCKFTIKIETKLGRRLLWGSLKKENVLRHLRFRSKNSQEFHNAFPFNINQMQSSETRFPVTRVLNCLHVKINISRLRTRGWTLSTTDFARDKHMLDIDENM